MARDAEPTRAALVRAAEELFAERGIEQVSLREISRASGARNAVAVQYHFDDRQGLLRAVLGKHNPGVEQARHRLLDQLEGRAPGLRALAGALVEPLAAKLSDPDGGPAYLRITAQLLARDPAARGPDRSRSIDRWRVMVEPHLAPEAAALHRRFAAIRFCAVELGRRAGTGPHRDDRLFTSQLVDLVAALLRAPVSPATARLAAARAGRGA